MPKVVTIDGPAGAGKSTAARRLAGRLGWQFLNTGAMFRAVTLAALRRGTDVASESQLDVLTADLEVDVSGGRVVLDGEDVTRELDRRRSEISLASGPIASSAVVRGHLLHWQREFAREVDTVTEGRDQGTVVFPDAFRKFFLTANEVERARRRVAELEANGQHASFEDVLADQRIRDARDAARTIAPMKPAADALHIDTSGKTIDQVVEELASHILIL
ncbi:(d)CMP kinase [Aquisphaera insulae]|uniref:(d)CMP kinase n=1 Tax=Aquisphaera insulae TaxID=2712864 RepID=UPI0013EB9613|nr:(d)CMP kinase [Aquisphaera insulae]